MNLVCPITKAPLSSNASRLTRADGAWYRCDDGIPVLLGPEIQGTTPPDKSGIYAEAYAEMGFYDAEARLLTSKVQAGNFHEISAEGILILDQIALTIPAYPSRRWLNARLDQGSQWDCYTHIGDIADKRVLQLGGTGLDAIQLMLAGAESAILVTPMLCEAQLARALAERYHVSLDCIVGIAEEIPLPSGSVDIVYSAGCVHHMTTEVAFPEVARVLARGGKFAAIEPWRAPLYSIGTRLLGKREANPFCRPLTPQRVAPLAAAFGEARYVQHGTLSRYPMLGLEKLGMKFPSNIAWHLGRCDDTLCSLIGLRRFGSGVSLLATK